MEHCSKLIGCFLPCTLIIYPRKGDITVLFTVVVSVVITVVLGLGGWVNGLGSMSSVAVSYGGNGEVFCGLKTDGSSTVKCYGSNEVILYTTPEYLKFSGLTGGDGFVCGLGMETRQPYCWGSSGLVQMGVPQPMGPGWEYAEISAGDHHLCGLRRNLRGRFSLVDCWGYNMSSNHVFMGRIKGITGGDGFNCGLFVENKTAFCWGDESSSRVISLIPREMRFRMIAAGSFHVCGIVEGADSVPFCWGRSMGNDSNEEERISVSLAVRGSVELTPRVPLVTIVGGKFHACGIEKLNRGVVCWGFIVERSTRPPQDVQIYSIASGDYFTCGILAGKSLSPVCWGYGFPSSLPMPAVPGVCRPTPCPPGFYEFKQGSKTCKPPNRYMCLPCNNPSSCTSPECTARCALNVSMNDVSEGKHFWAVQLPVIVAEVIFAVFMVIVVSLTAVLYVRYKLRNCKCSSKRNNDSRGSSSRSIKIRPEADELMIRRAKVFTYKELERATRGFKEESIVGRGSFSCVFKGVLRDGTTVAVKRAVMSSDQKKNSKEFHNELDLLSRLNHAHLLNLLGYCEEAEERLLVYEFMAHGSLHQHLHGKITALKEQLDWVRRVTITVQASRGIEYLHGYACPPVIHRDIKSSNILIDEEHNARVADFGLSLLGPTDSSSPLAELPAGTLGYLDPEYYRLHYLTTKSDVYSFGVLILEILSGRKAIDMKFEHGNIVEWAVPLIRSGDIHAILDPSLKPPPDIEALKRIANVACKCVRMRGRDRPSMDQVTTALERALALLMGTPCSEQPILPTEVVLGSSRMHKKPSQRSSNPSETDIGSVEEHQRTEFRAPSWITFPSVTSSQRVSDNDVENARNFESGRNVAEGGLVSLDEEIGPASPQESLFLKHNF